MSDPSPFQWFRIAEVNADGSETLTGMKAWLKAHPGKYPFDPSEKNSRTIARWLKQNGWTSKETPGLPGEPGEYVLYQPGFDPPVPPDDDKDKDYTFGLEAELRDFLASNLNLVKIGGQTLQLVGKEHPTTVGRIDILARDDDHAFYVFELKRAETPDEVIGQVARYMGWVMKNAANGKPVYGVIVAKEITEKLKYAVVPIPNIFLFEYQISFTLNPAALG